MNKDSNNERQLPLFIACLSASVALLCIAFLSPYLTSFYSTEISYKISSLLTPNAKALLIIFGLSFLTIAIQLLRHPKIILSFDIQDTINSYYIKHQSLAKAFLASFIILLVIYGSKLAFQIYTSDDYSVIDNHFNLSFFASHSGRWFLAPFSSLFFHNWSIINPYFNTIVSLFFLTLGGVVTAKAWNINDKLTIILITVLCVGSPFMAHNLYFNLSTAIHLSIFLASISAFLLTKKLSCQIIAMLIQIFAIGTYQATLQLTVIIILVWYILNLLNINDKQTLKKTSIKLLRALALVVIAYIVSSKINDIVLTAYHLEAQDRFALSKEIGIMQLIKEAFNFWHFTPYVGIKNINLQFWVISGLIMLGGAFSFIHIARSSKKLSSIKISLFIISIIACCYALKLPRLFGMDIPSRAMFQLSWFICAFIVLMIRSQIKLIRSFSILCGVLLIVYSFSHISAYYNSAHERTQKDMYLANEIATSIIGHEKYSNNKPINLYIIGENGYKRNDLPTNEMFTFSWSKYKGLEHFTSLNFNTISTLERRKIDSILISMEINNFPQINSTLFVNNAFVIILNKENIEKSGSYEIISE